jgi:hypothetical protein
MIAFFTAVAGLAVLGAAAAQAQDQGETASSAGCGVGTILFEGQQGVAPQVLAVTTNGTFGNQTFGISSGTLGCTQDGVVRPPTAVRMLLMSSLDNLATDVAQGEGETLDSLAQAMAIQDPDRAVFLAALQENFTRIFPSENVTADEVFTSINAVLVEEPTLRRYAIA